MEGRQKKRIIIVAIYLVLLITFCIFIYYAFLKPEETCFDKVKNQNEEDVDCGGVCARCQKIEAQPLVSLETGIVDSGIPGEYDFYSFLSNPNNIYGSQSFQYEIRMKDASGNVLTERTGESFILPGEKKYIVETNFKLETVPAKAELAIKSSQWIEFNQYYQKPDLEIVNKNYSEITGGVGFSEAKGLLKNKSPFDFELIKIRVILKDNNGKVVGLNSTQMRTVKSKEERDFRALWPNRFPGDVRNMEAQAEVNVFDSEIFMQRFFQTQKFQKY